MVFHLFSRGGGAFTDSVSRSEETPIAFHNAEQKAHNIGGYAGLGRFQCDIARAVRSQSRRLRVLSRRCSFSVLQVCGLDCTLDLTFVEDMQEGGNKSCPVIFFCMQQTKKSCNHTIAVARFSFILVQQI